RVVDGVPMARVCDKRVKQFLGPLGRSSSSSGAHCRRYFLHCLIQRANHGPIQVVGAAIEFMKRTFVSGGNSGTIHRVIWMLIRIREQGLYVSVGVCQCLTKIAMSQLE